MDNSVWISNYTFSSCENTILYNRPLDNEVLQLSNTGELTGSLFFNFGKETIPDEEKKDIMKYFKKFENYTGLQKITIIEDNYISGTFFMYGKTKSFFIDRKENKLFIGKESDIDVIGYHNNMLISCLIPGTTKAGDISLPTDVKKNLEAENFVLCLYYLE